MTRSDDGGGHGDFGVLDDDGETVLCHECGRWFRSIANHIGPAHGIGADEYRARHGLASDQSLSSRSTKRRKAHSARQVAAFGQLRAQHRSV
ncbi:MucR family transcriptional regulator [Williamsia sp.]|uniref:MucR family transcriptional regulator n=1 Tax=Williamsia sp. TaxID=1872085 RepID=UPI002F93B20D